MLTTARPFQGKGDHRYRLCLTAPELPKPEDNTPGKIASVTGPGLSEVVGKMDALMALLKETDPSLDYKICGQYARTEPQHGRLVWSFGKIINQNASSFFLLGKYW